MRAQCDRAQLGCLGTDAIAMITTNAEALVSVCSLGMPALLSSGPCKSKGLSRIMSFYKTNKDVS